MPHASLRGRRAPVKVTTGRSLSASAGPMPRTSQSASMDPNGPAESRLAMIRAASAGPIPGSDSMAAESARSRSTGAAGGRVAAGGCFARFFPRGAGGRCRTESIRPSCRSSAATASGSAIGRLARHIRTLPPDSATMARNHSAFRSLVVGTSHNYRASPEHAHRSDAGGIGVVHGPRGPGTYLTRVSATSPTTCRDRALILSMVSSCVWCRFRVGSPPQPVPPSRQ